MAPRTRASGKRDQKAARANHAEGAAHPERGDAEDLAGVVHPVMGLKVGAAAKRDFPPVVVPEGKYFLMGDSRDNSFDSREYGFASRDAILGKAEGILVSLDINDSYLPRWDRFFSELR